LLILLGSIAGCGSPSRAARIGQPAAAQVRLGYFANVTHAQALIGVARGDFQKALGSVPLKPLVFNAGPSTVEAIFAGELDLAYIGPSPAINAYIKSKGQAVHIISGAAANGVVIVARKDSGIARMADLAGRRLATPQYGNTQDISARHYLLHVLKQPVKEQEILPVANAEQLGLFKAGRLDAAWVPEPWGARLVHEAGGVIVEEEKNLWPQRNFAVAVLIASSRFLDQYPETAAAFLKAHVELTEWINVHPAQAAEFVNAEMQKLTGKALKEDVLADAFSRLTFSTDTYAASIQQFADWAYELGFMKEKPELKGLVDLRLLEKAQQRGAAK
jgi:NitT/TauT family transport system substrate-binding protein